MEVAKFTGPLWKRQETSYQKMDSITDKLQMYSGSKHSSIVNTSTAYTQYFIKTFIFTIEISP
jgi:hypothetical protein